MYIHMRFIYLLTLSLPSLNPIVIQPSSSRPLQATDDAAAAAWPI